MLKQINDFVNKGRNIETLVLSTLVLFLSSCAPDESSTVSGITSGEIEYKIDFPELGNNEFLKTMLPQEAKGYFDGDKYRIEMSFGMGVVLTTGISNATDKKAWLLLDFFGNKYATEDVPGVMGDELPDFNLVKGESSGEISGYKCYSMTATNPLDKTEYKVQYTEEIGTSNLYWNTPFKQLDKGILMDFPFDTYGISMRMAAKKIKGGKVDPKLFELPEGYEVVSQEKFGDLLGDLMEGAGLPMD